MFGVMYDKGQGAQDFAQAAAWYRKAAEQGHVLAQNNLADVQVGQGAQRRCPSRSVVLPSR